jgi:hypothetical protein
MLYVLSERASVDHVSWSTSFELEDVLCRTCDAVLVAPRAVRVHRRLEPLVAPVLGPRYRRVDLGEVAPDSTLLVVAMGPTALRMLDSIPDWRRRFARVAAYVVDLYPAAVHRLLPRFVGDLDYLFVSYDQIAEAASRRSGTAVAVVRQAVDVFQQGAGGGDRPLDLTAYGRQPEALTRLLSERYNRPRSPRIFTHSTWRHPEIREWRQDRALFWQLLRRTRVSLGFCASLTHPDRVGGVGPVTARWYEGIAAGCVLAGRRPAGPEAREELDWEDSVVELPMEPTAFLTAVEELLSDRARCEAASWRNYLHALRRHDWRYRVRQMLTHLGLAIPSKLIDEIEELGRRAAAVEGSRGV